MDKKKLKVSKKKFTKIRLWPSIVSFIVFTGLFLSMIMYVLIFYVDNMLSFNITESAGEVEVCINAVFDGSNTTEEARKIEYENVSKYIVNIQDMAVYDSNGNLIEHYTDNKLIEFRDDTVLYTDPDTGYIVYSESDVFKSTNEDNVVTIDRVNAIEAIFHSLERDGTLSFEYWYSFNINGNNVVVRYDKVFYGTTFNYFIGMVVILVFLLLLITGYHIYILFSSVAKNRTMVYLLYTDDVTNGNNWLYFTKRAEKLIKKNHKNKKAQYSYCMINLRMEKYRSFTTSYGIEEGEKLLETFDSKINSLIDKKEVVAHYEKADFAILMKFDKKAKVEKRINNILLELDSAMPDEKFYFSIGVARVGKKETDPLMLHNHAALARNQVSEGDEKRISWFSEEQQDDVLWERIVENDMERALEAKEFVVYLQPKYSPRGVLGGAEALIRWIHPEKGFISPGKFIPIFERNGFIIKIDDFMISETAKLQAKWLAEGKRVVPVSVNVSRAHFAKSNLAEHIARLVDKAKCPHEYIEIELTESAFFDDKNVLVSTVKKLQDLGFKCSMDDFGAGYSSLNSLKELPLDVIKIDAEFFRNVSDLERANLIVSQTISLAKKLGMKTVAEGVEVKSQVDFLAQKGCDLIQGFYFSKPLPVDEYDVRLTEGRIKPKEEETKD